MSIRLSLLALALGTCALPALAEEVNIYSHRQPELIQPLLDLSLIHILAGDDNSARAKMDRNMKASLQ